MADFVIYCLELEMEKKNLNGATFQASRKWKNPQSGVSHKSNIEKKI